MQYHIVNQVYNIVMISPKLIPTHGYKSSSTSNYIDFYKYNKLLQINSVYSNLSTLFSISDSLFQLK